jgi:hypothetical protein
VAAKAKMGRNKDNVIAKYILIFYFIAIQDQTLSAGSTGPITPVL